MNYKTTDYRDDLYDAITRLQTVCKQHMLPLEDVGFSGDIGLTNVAGVEIRNTELDEIGREE